MGLNRADPAFPPYADLLHTNHGRSYAPSGRADTAANGGARPVSAAPRMQGAEPSRAAVPIFAPRRRASRPIIPCTTLHNCAIARRQAKEPPALHAHAATESERAYTHDPTPGMLWRAGKGWYTTPERPSVDERYLRQ